MRLETGKVAAKPTSPLDLLPLEAWSMIAERASCVPDLWALTATCRWGGSMQEPGCNIPPFLNHTRHDT